MCITNLLNKYPNNVEGKSCANETFSERMPGNLRYSCVRTLGKVLLIQRIILSFVEMLLNVKKIPCIPPVFHSHTYITHAVE